MAISYSVAVDTDDDGTYDRVITTDVIALWWRRGMASPFDSMAAPSQAHITLRNHDRAYSPEVTPLLPGKRARIQSSDGTTIRTHFTGGITAVEPLPGEDGEQTARLTLRGYEADLAENRVGLSLQAGVRADTVIDALLDAVLVRRALLDGCCIIGVEGYNTLDSVNLFGDALTRSLEAGLSTFAAVGDTWGDGIPADVAIEQIAASERGRFFFDRDGDAVFYNRHHTLLNVTPDASFSDDMDGLTYRYGDAIANRVQITITPRATGSAGTLLWSLTGTQAVPPRSVRQIMARYRDDNQNAVGALAVAPVIYSAADGSGADATSELEVALLEAGASAAKLEIRSRTDRTVYLTGLSLYGTPVISGDPVTLEQTDPTSITFYGPRTLSLFLPALTSLDEADQMARYELARRKDPRGSFLSLSLSTRSHPTHALARTLFDRISITETQTGHSADYILINEEHQVDKGGTRHRVQWLLEPADSDRFFIIGTHQLDGSHVLAY